MLAIDYAWWRPDPAQVKAAGYSAIIRYFSHDSTKSLTKDEIEAAHAIGLGVGSIFEDGATRALAGSPGGYTDGAFANAYADSIGWPTWKPIGYAIDFDVQPSQMAQVVDYVKAAGTTGRVAFGYGKTEVVDALVAAGIGDDWQACAWSNGVVNNKAALYQRLRPTTGLQGSFDEDVVLHPSNDLWFPGDVPPAAPTPTPSGADMDRLYRTASSTAAYAYGGNCRVWVDGDWWKAAGSPPIIELPDTSNFWKLPVVGPEG